MKSKKKNLKYIIRILCMNTKTQIPVSLLLSHCYYCQAFSLCNIPSFSQANYIGLLPLKYCYFVFCLVLGTRGGLLFPADHTQAPVSPSAGFLCHTSSVMSYTLYQQLDFCLFLSSEGKQLFINVKRKGLSNVFNLVENSGTQISSSLSSFVISSLDYVKQ